MAGVKDFVSERVQGLAEQARELRTKPVENARKVAAKSADGIRGLREPVRAFARSGVKLSSISQSTAQSLIELQEQIVTSALTDAAAQLERAAATVSVTELVRDQAGVLRTARERIIEDMAQAVAILRDAGVDVRKVATQTYGQVRAKPARKAPAKKKAPARKKAAKKAPARKKARKAPAKKAKRGAKAKAAGK